jgi:hypothetical protein
MESNLDKPPLIKRWMYPLRVYGHVFDSDSRGFLLFVWR